MFSSYLALNTAGLIIEDFKLKLLFKYLLRGVVINLLNAKLNPICLLLALLGTHHNLHVSRIRVK